MNEGEFCTGCGHRPAFHSVPIHHCTNGACIQSLACVMEGCGCNYYYEGGDA